MNFTRGILTLFFLLSVSVYAQTVSGPQLEIKSPIDFGTLKQGEKQRIEVLYQNTGNSDLIITNVISSSSFIKATYEGIEIEPGKYGKIQLDIVYSYFYNEENPPSGDQEVRKTLMIMTNEADSNSHMIKIVGKMAQPITN